eukprot:EG_transcript_12690
MPPFWLDGPLPIFVGSPADPTIPSSPAVSLPGTPKTGPRLERGPTRPLESRLALEALQLNYRHSVSSAATAIPAPDRTALASPGLGGLPVAVAAALSGSPAPALTPLSLSPVFAAAPPSKRVRSNGDATDHPQTTPATPPRPKLTDPEDLDSLPHFCPPATTTFPSLEFSDASSGAQSRVPSDAADASTGSPPHSCSPPCSPTLDVPAGSRLLQYIRTAALPTESPAIGSGQPLHGAPAWLPTQALPLKP